jgi:hypothetical protein
MVLSAMVLGTPSGGQVINACRVYLEMQPHLQVHQGRFLFNMIKIRNFGEQQL